MPRSRRPTEKTRAETLGSELRRLRRRKKLSLRELADQLPMSASNLGRIETGTYGPPPENTIQLIAKALNTDPEPLLVLAGQRPSDFEQRVLGELRTLRTELRAIRDRIEQLNLMRPPQ